MTNTDVRNLRAYNEALRALSAKLLVSSYMYSGFTQTDLVLDREIRIDTIGLSRERGAVLSVDGVEMAIPDADDTYSAAQLAMINSLDVFNGGCLVIDGMECHSIREFKALCADRQKDVSYINDDGVTMFRLAARGELIQTELPQDRRLLFIACALSTVMLRVLNFSTQEIT